MSGPQTGSGPETILNFHGLGQPHAGVDAGEARYWIGADAFARVLDRVVQAHAGGARIGLSFDDGNQSDLDIALPLLAARGLTAQFFVLVGRIGQPHYLDRAGIGALQSAGMTIGLHGRHHLDWRGLDAAALADETVTARRELAAMTGTAIDAVAVPFGAYRRRTMRWLAAQGFAAIYTSDGGASAPHRRIRSRTSLTHAVDDAILDAVLADRLAFSRRLRRGLSTTLRRYIL